MTGLVSNEWTSASRELDQNQGLDSSPGEYFARSTPPTDSSVVSQPGTRRGASLAKEPDEPRQTPVKQLRRSSRFKKTVTPSPEPEEQYDLDPFIETEETPSEEGSQTEELIIEKERKTVQAKLGKKQGITIASWNTRGKRYDDKRSKWKDIVRKDRIAILAVQETKMTDKDAEKLEEENPRLKIINNGKHSNKEGVLFAINLDMVSKDFDETRITHKVLIPSRASQLRITWAEDQELNLVNIYAPNATKQKEEFLVKLTAKLKKEYTKGMCLLGDFNCVEEAVDRCPMHEDDEKVQIALRNLKKKLKLIDGWRVQNPEKKDYTLYQTGSGSMARIDRIYMRKELYKLAYDWTIESNVGISDHNLITVKLLKDKLPYCGKGLWRLQENIIEHEPFRNRAGKELKTYKTWIEKYESEERKCGGSTIMIKALRKKGNNPQSRWEVVKNKIGVIAREEAIKIKNRKNKLRAGLKEDIAKQLKKANSNTLAEYKKDKAKEEAFFLKNELDRLDREKLERARESAQARYLSEGETGSRYWFNLNKPRLPQNLIYALQNDRHELKTETKEMMKIASEYHRKLQAKPEMNQERREAIEKIKNHIKTKLDIEKKKELRELTTAKEIKEAIRSSKNGKCPGHSGITYEFWKSWPEPKNKKDKAISISEILETVFNDIEKHGMEEEGYTKGIMYLLYKKKDKTKIENYRPITLLETDYKLHTKTIANKLGDVCKTLIKDDQAGFVPGRSLFDHTRLASIMPQYAESEFEDGCIVSLDQEKAYDKIDHEYLWTILRTFGFPEHFINVIKTLYKNAKTEVMVNGERDEPIEILRGVRQGDPMSCLLYNLAIEPLAGALRQSRHLKGFKIPDYKRLIVKLFADDTLVYLYKNDKFADLERIIKLFCTASTAKFNVEKTEVLPIGSEEHRKKMIETRQMGNDEENKIPEHAKIIKEGEGMRTLGAWVGNNISTTEQWKKIMEKQNQVMETWAKSRPTLKGKELILKSLVTSRSWFLATVNELPEELETEMNKQMKDFLWDGKERGLMELKCTTEIREKGGLGIPNIRARLEAIHVMWLKKYLANEKERPTWCWVADVLIKKDVTKGTNKQVTQEMRTKWIMQNWRVAQYKHSKLPSCLSTMLKVGEKYNVHPYSRKVDKKIKRDMPVWYHCMYKGKNFGWSKKAAKCILKTHKINKMGELQDMIEKNKKQKGCKTHKACHNMAKKILGSIPDKWNPELETPYRDNLDHTKNRLKKNQKIGEDPVTYNPDITDKGNPEETIRIFLEKVTLEEATRKPAYRKRNEATGEKWVVYTDGSCLNGNTSKARTGAGIYIENKPELSTAIRVPGEIQTNQRGELVAIIKALEIVPENDEMLLKSDSQYALKGLVENAKEWEDIGWLEIENSDLFKKALQLLNERGAVSTLEWVKGHSGEEGNETADKKANEGARKEETDEIDLEIPEEHKLPGAKLSAMTQKLAYGHILNLKELNPIKKRTKENLEDTMTALEDAGAMRPSKKKIWSDMNDKTIRKNIQDFMWKTMHGNLRVGVYWKNIENYQDRAECKNCQQLETMDHIFFQCEIEGREELWKYAEKLWRNTNTEDVEWVYPSAALIRGLGSMQIKNKKGKIDKPMTKRYKLIVSETAWVIWKLRNERVIAEKQTTKTMYKVRWVTEMNNRIKTSFVQALKSKPEKRKKKLEEFKKEWTGNENIAQIVKGDLVLRRWDKVICK